MSKKLKVVIVDTSSITHQLSGNIKSFKTSTGISSGHIYNFLNKILAFKKNYFPDVCIFALDKGRAGRDELDPNYKKNRSGKEHRHSIVNDTVRILELLPVIRCYKKGYEADDVLFTLASLLYASNEIEEIILVSKDYDLAFCLVYYPKLRHFMTLAQELSPTSLFMKYGCSPWMLPLHKAVFGDVSDSITGIHLQKTKQLVAEEFMHTDNPLELVKKHIPRKHWKQLLSNLKLTKPKYVNGMSVKVGKENPEELAQLLALYEIKEHTVDSVYEKIPNDASAIKQIEAIITGG